MVTIGSITSLIRKLLAACIAKLRACKLNFINPCNIHLERRAYPTTLCIVLGNYSLTLVAETINDRLSWNIF